MRCHATRLIFLLVGLGLSFNSFAEISAEVLEYGYYQTLGKVSRERNLSTPTGYERNPDRVELVESTDVIPMQKGRLFGFKFRIEGFPKDQVATDLRLVVTHPPIVRPNGSIVAAYQYPVTLDVVGGVVENQSGYSLDHDYELVQGQWKFQYWLRDQMLVEQSFSVVKSVPKPEQQGQDPLSSGKNTKAGGKKSAEKVSKKPAAKSAKPAKKTKSRAKNSAAKSKGRKSGPINSSELKTRSKASQTKQRQGEAKSVKISEK